MNDGTTPYGVRIRSAYMYEYSVRIPVCLIKGTTRKKSSLLVEPKDGTWTSTMT